VPQLAIKAESLSKQYRLGSGYGYKTLRESMAKASGSALRLAGRPGATESRRVVWALKDVSFEIATGDLVALIGLNGAGKTTVLKILSRITKPTAGWAETYGRVGSLLEVGTGFHPELTGRENVYLSGAVLGMRKAEIKRRFDEIVEFADISDFLDTPIKRYSSGMQVRLAFAVAAHLEPEILIVDEVLAVGDIEFQRKCLGKMGEITSEGRTVIFVSHNMSLVRSLCRRGILLAGGSVVTDTSIDLAISEYLQGLESVSSQDLLERVDRRGHRDVLLQKIEISSDEGVAGRLVTGAPARFVFQLAGAASRLTCTFTVFTNLGQPVSTLSSAPPSADDHDDAAIGSCFECTIDELLLVPGRYRIDVTVRGNTFLQDRIEGAAFFEVEEGPFRGRPLPPDGHGDIVLPHRWRTPGSSVLSTRG
jgi:lipopolysaccharide transport system ATP-binding protein